MKCAAKFGEFRQLITMFTTFYLNLNFIFLVQVFHVISGKMVTSFSFILLLLSFLPSIPPLHFSISSPSIPYLNVYLNIFYQLN